MSRPHNTSKSYRNLKYGSRQAYFKYHKPLTVREGNELLMNPAAVRGMRNALRRILLHPNPAPREMKDMSPEEIAAIYARNGIEVPK